MSCVEGNALDPGVGQQQDGLDGQTVVRCGMSRITRPFNIDRHANTQISRMQGFCKVRMWLDRLGCLSKSKRSMPMANVVI